MVARALLSLAAVGFFASSAQAVFTGTVDFEDGTTGALSKQLHTSNPQAFAIGDFGGPGNLEFNFHGTAPLGFKSTYLLADTSGTGAGDVYGDVTLKTLYKPSTNGFEFALTSRVQEYPLGTFSNTASGWGVWATGGTEGFAPGLNIAYEPELGASAVVKASVLTWADTTAIDIDPTKWYDLTFSTIGTLATATMVELDGAFAPVPGHTATVSYNMNTNPAEYAATGFAGTRGAQGDGTVGYFLDNVQVIAAPIPEPASLVLLGVGGIALLRRRHAR
jgi:hypothetical protein